MNKTSRLSVLAVLSVLSLGASAPLAFATTLNVSSDSASIDYRNAVVKAADHMVTTQNTDGGWDWGTPDSSPATGSAVNTLGVTAQALVDAYRLTHQAKYLIAANKTFALLQKNSAPSTFKLRGPDISFLVDLSTVTGDPKYADFAKTGWDNDLTRFGSGTATGFGDSIRDARHSQGWDGLIPWDINLFVQGVTKLANYSVANAAYGADATALAQVIFDDVNAATPLFNWNDDTENGYLFGLTGMLSAMSTVTVSSAITANDVSTKLMTYSHSGAFFDLSDVNAQGATPSVDDHLTTVQTTAYAVKALMQSPQNVASAQPSIDYLLAQQDSVSGAWKDGVDENT